MARNVQTIRIESILGGHAPSTHFAASDQFLDSYGIDPAEIVRNGDTGVKVHPSGLIAPTGGENVDTGGVLNAAPMWIVTNPRRSDYFLYDHAGSVYTLDTSYSLSGLGDLNDGGSARGNGAAYYDNYIYFARDTTVARYGPLDGSASFTDDFWVNTLGQTALSNTQYPRFSLSDADYPNHILHRHSDGRLYILDVVDNQGTIHYIKTTKTTVEGDTDDGSTYDVLNVGYGLWPTAIESYGSNLVMAFAEIEESYDLNGGGGGSKTTSKIAFWDTTSDNINNIIWVEYPDALVGAIKNVNGTLYFFSGAATRDAGTRILRYIGGSSFEEVHVLGNCFTPHQGCVDSQGDRLYFGTVQQNTPLTRLPHVFAFGRGPNGIGSGLFSVQGISSNSINPPTSLIIEHRDQILLNAPLVGWGEKAGGYGLDRRNSYGNVQNEWYSQLYKIGHPFKITKVRVPLAQPLISGMEVKVQLFMDGLVGNTPTWKSLTDITSTNFGTQTQMITYRPENIVGDNSVVIIFRFTGTEQCVISLPIIIEYELLDVDTTKP